MENLEKNNRIKQKKNKTASAKILFLSIRDGIKCLYYFSSTMSELIETSNLKSKIFIDKTGKIGNNVKRLNQLQVARQTKAVEKDLNEAHCIYLETTFIFPSFFVFLG